MILSIVQSQSDMLLPSMELVSVQVFSSRVLYFFLRCVALRGGGLVCLCPFSSSPVLIRHTDVRNATMHDRTRPHVWTCVVHFCALSRSSGLRSAGFSRLCLVVRYHVHRYGVSGTSRQKWSMQNDP